MAEGADGKNRHFILDGVTRAERFRSPQQGGGTSSVPERNRRDHGAELLRQVDALRAEAASARRAQVDAGVEEGLGLQVEFESFPEIELAFESLARERSGIELLNVRHDATTTHATVFVPDGKLDHFESIVRDYLTEKRDKNGRSLDHKQLLNAIREIRAASLRALWTDDADVFPTSDGESFWWEVWLPVRKNRGDVVAGFLERAVAQGMRVAPGELTFPERTVVLVYASTERMRASIVTLNSVAELRRAKETAEFFDSLPAEEQSEWLNELLGRIEYPEEGEHVPHVCFLDTGVNRGHPLIEGALAEVDLHSVNPAWGTADTHGHGTQMAGLSLIGDLTAVLAGSDPVKVGHRLESVKLLTEDGANGDDPQHHGYLTIEAVARPEITAPSRARVFGMATTARDNRDRGRPSAWSAAIDRLAADSDGNGAIPRLLVVSAGNINDPNAWVHYPASNDTDGVHDPAQAWNALTVGACTDLVKIAGPDATGYEAVAPSGGLSPFSTTSLTWQPHWPLKPDVVLEGGNAARDSLGAVWLPSLSLLTTHHQPTERLFTTANATSAATALAARMAAEVASVYPDLWPETIRGLIVHSAEWTDVMRKLFLPASGRPSKSDYLHLIQRCGFGMPNLDRAVWSVSNSLTLVVQEKLHPFTREGSKEPTTRDMHLHDLPWPEEALESLGEAPVEMRVTLSYFIEPNPSARGVRSRYRYESHGLRFEVKRALESVTAFRSRINAAARDEEEGSKSGESDSAWLVGKQARHRGSLHSDIWRGTAAELAARGVLGVYPALGWWKTRPRLERYHNEARYALIVSIRAPEVEVDLYGAIASQIGVSVHVEA